MWGARKHGLQTFVNDRRDEHRETPRGGTERTNILVETQPLQHALPTCRSWRQRKAQRLTKDVENPNPQQACENRQNKWPAPHTKVPPKHGKNTVEAGCPTSGGCPDVGTRTAILYPGLEPRETWAPGTRRFINIQAKNRANNPGGVKAACVSHPQIHISSLALASVAGRGFPAVAKCH